MKKSRAIVFTWDLEIGTTYCALFTTRSSKRMGPHPGVLRPANLRRAGLVQGSSGTSAVLYDGFLYMVMPLDSHHRRGQERQRRPAHPRADRRRAAPWLRDRRPDRDPVGRDAAIHAGLALRHALSPRGSRPDPRPLGRASRPAPPPLLPHYQQGADGARVAARRLEPLHCRGDTGGRAAPGAEAGHYGRFRSTSHHGEPHRLAHEIRRAARRPPGSRSPTRRSKRWPSTSTRSTRPPSATASSDAEAQRRARAALDESALRRAAARGRRAAARPVAVAVRGLAGRPVRV